MLLNGAIVVGLYILLELVIRAFNRRVAAEVRVERIQDALREQREALRKRSMFIPSASLAKQERTSGPVDINMFSGGDK